MKIRKFLFMLFVVIGLTTVSAIAGNTVQISFKFKCTHIAAGYDHLSRLKVYVDGGLAGTSSEKLESEENTMSVQVTKGEHSVRAVLESLYEGNWEEHLISNTYSIDCLYEVVRKFTKKNTLIVLEFDIDQGTILKKK